VTINGIPIHPLVVHAAVVLAPIAALLAVAYVVPKWRDGLRWPLAVVAVVAAVCVWFAAYTGGQLEDTMRVSMNASPHLAHAIHHHEDLAGKLQASTWVLAALGLGAWFLHTRPGLLRNGVLVLLPLGGVAALVLAVLTGDAGAQAVWAA